jgi:hypothetical protein
MSTTPPAEPPPVGAAAAPATPPSPPSRARNGLGVAALVIGVASLVAASSFLLFPVALVSAIVGIVFGILALSRGRSGVATNSGQATAGLVCSMVALIIAVVLTVRVGTWVAHNSGAFTRFDKCIAQAGDRREVSTCIANFANEVRE